MNDLSNVGQLPRYEFTLYGLTGAKKNRYTPGPRGMHKGAELRAELNDLEAQIPGNVRDLRLLHPDMVLKLSCKNGRRDRDGILTTVLDLLVRCQVITDDNIANFNGKITIEPAVLGDSDEATVILYPRNVILYPR